MKCFLAVAVGLTFGTLLLGCGKTGDPTIAGPFHVEANKISPALFDGKWEVTIICDREEPILIKDVLVDGHPTQWVTSRRNHGAFEAMLGIGDKRPLDEVGKGEWILVSSQEPFTELEIVSDKENYKGSIPLSKWRR
jgi:hypothetical protein